MRLVLIPFLFKLPTVFTGIWTVSGSANRRNRLVNERCDVFVLVFFS